jgi:Tfp pilus assembly protein PilP
MKLADILMIGLLVAVIICVVSPVFAQQSTATQEQSKDQSKETSSKPDKEVAMQGMEEVDAEYFYDAKEKRDPFVPLRKGGPKQPPKTNLPCPAGCLISEMELQGIVKDGKGNYFAIFFGPDKKSYNMKVGEKFYDGEITAIDTKKVTLKESVQDPTEIIRFREVLKWLHPTEEGKLE